MVRLSATPIRNGGGKIIGALKRAEYVCDLPSDRLPGWEKSA
jgi:hypothetical protein